MNSSSSVREWDQYPNPTWQANAESVEQIREINRKPERLPSNEVRHVFRGLSEMTPAIETTIADELDSSRFFTPPRQRSSNSEPAASSSMNESGLSETTITDELDFSRFCTTNTGCIWE